MAESITMFLGQYLTAELVVFIISMMPVLELRGGLIAAAVLDLDWRIATPICIAGTMLPIPFILLFIRAILQFMIKHGIFKKLAEWIERKGMTKGAQMMEKYPQRVKLGLFLFVAIPLPGTGAWTGSLVASLLGIPVRESAAPLCLGVFGSAVIMLFLAYVLPALLTA